MPVQKKSNTSVPVKKKKKNWIQITVSLFVIIVVVMCVLSFSNVSNFFKGDQTGTASGIVAEGDPAAIYFTSTLNGTKTFSNYADSVDDLTPYRLVADSNSSITDNDYPIMLRTGNTTIPYGIFGKELNAMAKAIVGQDYGSTFNVECPYSVMVPCTADEFKTLGYDISEVEVGDFIPMTLDYTDLLGNTGSYLRIGEIYSIEDDLSGLIINCGCDSLEVKIVGKFNA